MLTATESIVWKVPAPMWARRKVKEYQGLAADEEAAKRKATLAAELPQLTEYRLTFGTVTMAEEMQREELLKTVREPFEEKYGISPGAFSLWFLDKFVRDIEPTVEYEGGAELDRNAASLIWLHTRDLADWATFMSCLKQVEMRQVSMLNGSDPKWGVVAIPKEWYNFPDFIKQLPRTLLDACVAVCNSLNPGVWEVSTDADAKNFGGVNESI